MNSPTMGVVAHPRATMCHLRSAIKSLNDLVSFLNASPASKICALPQLGKKKKDLILTLRESGRVTPETLTDLPGISPNIVASWSGSSHVAEIIDLCQYVRQSYGNELNYPNSVTSIDSGTSFTSMVSVVKEENGFRVNEWQRIQLVSLKPYKLQSAYSQIIELCTKFPKGDTYLLELQSHRTLKSNSGFLEVSLRLRLQEAMLYAIAQERKMSMLPVSPQKVGRYFELETRYQKKKRSGVTLVNGLLREEKKTPLGTTLIISPALREFYDNEKKCDDLSDCLLQAIAFMEWMELMRVYRGELI